jgi:siroheme synthase
VRDALLARGAPPHTPVLLAESAGRLVGQRRLGALADLEALAAHAGDGPVLLLVGEAFSKSDVTPLSTLRLARG